MLSTQYYLRNQREKKKEGKKGTFRYKIELSPWMIIKVDIGQDEEID